MSEVLTYIGDDFDGWMNQGNNPERLPVVQYQTPQSLLPSGHLGGWVLQKPNPNPPYNWVAIPLSPKPTNTCDVANQRRPRADPEAETRSLVRSR
jgi:hypothetical protein